MGDKNAHNTLWGSNRLDKRGKMLEEALNQNGLVCLNEDLPTYHRHYDNVFSNIDLTFCSAEIALDYKWQVNKEQH